MYDKVQIYKFKFNASSLGTFDYRMLMYNENIPYGEKEKKIVREFRKASASMGTRSATGVHDPENVYWLQIKELTKRTLQHGSRQYVTDVLIRGLFHEHKVRKKAAFWDCFGDIVYENLRNNLPEKTKLCLRCGKRFRNFNTGRYCETCEPLGEIETITTATCVVCGCSYVTRDTTSGAICPVCRLATKKAICIDCGISFNVAATGRPPDRCPDCRKQRTRVQKNESQRKIRMRN